MRRKTYYTFLFAKNDTSNLKKFSIESKSIYMFLGVTGLLFGLQIIFLTDYFGLYVDKWQMSKLKRENQKLEERFNSISAQLRDLEKTVHQVSDFSKKLHLITNSDPSQINSFKMIGKIHSNSAIMALSAHSHSTESVRLPSSVKKHGESTPFTEGALELRVERLKGKSEWVKQEAWTLYTDLLEKKEVLDNTPSILPVKGWVSSHFGYRNETIFADHEPYFHRGIDVVSEEGSPVLASADGKVVWTGYDEHGYGNLVVLDHGYGLKTYYAHLSQIKTKMGKAVEKGEVIAHVGSTGRSTGPHLHYEVRIFGEPVNPDNYILDQSDLFVYGNDL
ncbi:MAG: M23 family metallopeptidase [Oligoflexia bacterium]|nr:M23 family metallopeptidase [Oligoflexia bacterium]